MNDDNDLIRRGDALDVLTDWSLGPEEAIAKMRAIPASPALQEARDKIDTLEALLATARSDALRESAGKCKAAISYRENQLETMDVGQYQKGRRTAGKVQAEILRDQILALIPEAKQ